MVRLQWLELTKRHLDLYGNWTISPGFSQVKAVAGQGISYKNVGGEYSIRKIC